MRGELLNAHYFNVIVSGPNTGLLSEEETKSIFDTMDRWRTRVAEELQTELEALMPSNKIEVTHYDM